MVTHWLHQSGFKTFRNQCIRLLQKEFKLAPNEAICILNVYGQGVHHYYGQLKNAKCAVQDVIEDMKSEK